MSHATIFQNHNFFYIVNSTCLVNWPWGYYIDLKVDSNLIYHYLISGQLAHLELHICSINLMHQLVGTNLVLTFKMWPCVVSHQLPLWEKFSSLWCVCWHSKICYWQLSWAHVHMPQCFLLGYCLEQSSKR